MGSSSSSSSSDDSDSNSDSDSDKNNDKKKLGKRDTKQKSLTGNGSSGLKRKTGSNSNTSGGGTGSGSNQNRNQNAKNSKNQKPNSGESKGLAGGTITNINTNLKTIRTGALSKVAQVLTFDDILNEEPKTKTINATLSCGIPGSEKQPKRGQTIKKSDFSKNSSLKNSDKSGGFLTNQANNTSDTSSKKINHTYRSTILGQAIGKLLENKSKSNISVQKMEKSKKSSPNKSEQDLGNNKNKKLVKSKSSNFDSDVDADVEDELSESDLAVISKPKLVRKSASLSLTSPEKGLLKSSHSDLKSGIETNVNRSYRRAAASKASDRINRESRGRLSLSSSSSDDSRISDLDEDPDLVINNSKSRSSPGELPGRSLKNNSRTIGSGTKSLSITEKIKSTNKKKDLSSDADSDFKSAKTARMATTPTVLPITSKKERPGHGSTPMVATPGSGPKPEVGSNRKWTPTGSGSKPEVDPQTIGHGADSNSRPSTSVVKIALKRKQTTQDNNLEKLQQKPKKPKVDSEEKENKNNTTTSSKTTGTGGLEAGTSTVATPVSTTPTSSTSLKQMSWPEQLARHKAARSTPTATGSNSTNSTTTTTPTTTGQQRHSIDSMDSMEMELAGSESLENGVSNPVPTPPSTKKAIILPILGKKKNLVT